MKLLVALQVVRCGVDPLIWIRRLRGGPIEIEETQQLYAITDVDPAVVVDIERLGANGHRTLGASIRHVDQVENRIRQVEPQI